MLNWTRHPDPRTEAYEATGFDDDGNPIAELLIRPDREEWRWEVYWLDDGRRTVGFAAHVLAAGAAAERALTAGQDASLLPLDPSV